MTSKEDIAGILLGIGAVSLNATNPFKYASGMLSPIYTNCRILISYPKERKIIVDSFIEFIDREIGRENIDVIVGTASSGISLATYLGERMKLPIAYVRAAPKSHGKGKQIEGLIKQGSRALLISDIISTEQDLPISVNVLKENNCKVVYCLAIFNNSLNIVDKFLDSEKIKHHCLSDLETLLTVAHVKGRITSFDKNHVLEWMKNPHDWHTGHKEKIAKFSEESKVKIAQNLLKIQAITLNTKTPYRFASGILSPIYTDCRLLMSYPKEWRDVIDSAINIIVNEIGMQNIDVIGGTATAGISHASYLAQRLEKPMVYIKTSEENGIKKSKIEGVVKPGQKVVIIEDLISTGGSLFDSARAVRNAGGAVETCLSIFSYGIEKAKKAAAEEKIRIISLSDVDVLLDVAVKQKYIKEEEKALVKEWVSDTAGWGKKRGFE